MSRFRDLLAALACRTQLRRGKSKTVSGSLPLTQSGSFGGFPLVGYGIKGGAQVSGTPLPTAPLEPAFVGEKIGTGGTQGLALTFTVTDAAGHTETRTLDCPSVEPLRSVSGVFDELDYASGKLIRRIGVERNPVLRVANKGSCGTNYPAVSLRIGDGTTIPTYPHILSSHWFERRKYYILNGYSVGMEVYSGSLYVNMPRAVYRRYVKGSTGKTVVQSNTLVPSTATGTYRCDLADGSSTIFDLTEPLHGVNGFRDVVAVSKTSATLIRRMAIMILHGDEDFEEEEDFAGSGESIFYMAKEDFDAEPEPATSICSHFEYADMYPEDMVFECTDPAFCDDEDYWYFFLPGASGLSDFLSYLEDEDDGGTPVKLIYALSEPEVSTLSSSNVPTANAGNVTVIDEISDQRAFDSEAIYTLVPAMQSFMADEAAAGRPVTFYYVLPTSGVTETTLTLPSLPAGEGRTTLSVTSTSQDGIDPTEGHFTVLCDDTESE